jgi:hypothetical protein
MIIFVVIFVVIMVGRNRAATDLKLRTIVSNLMMVHASEDARALCKELRKKYPELCAGIDYTLKMEGDNVKIDEWNNDKPRPDE